MAMNHAAPESPQGMTEQQIARRRLLRGGAAAAPVVLTLTSHPVMAGTGTCTAASSFASINTSRVHAGSSCTGKTPDWWKNPSNYVYWPTSKYTKTTLFQNCLASYSACYNKTLLEVLSMPDTSGNNCAAKYMVAALLNAATGRTPGVMDENTTKTIWSKFVTGSFKYTPTAGITWYADYAVPAPPAPMVGGLIEWLKTTMV